jgi:pantothenate kinase
VIKKVLIASGFLIGGYFLIKKVLPSISKSNNLKLNVQETKSADDVVNEILNNKNKQRQKIERELKTHYNKDGSKNRKWFEARNNFKV